MWNPDACLNMYMRVVSDIYNYTNIIINNNNNNNNNDKIINIIIME